MRQQRKGLREIMIRKPKDKEGLVYGWQRHDSAIIKARILPFGPSSSGGPLQVLAAQYGDRILRMLMLYYSGPVELKERDGLCIDTLQTELCDYRIVAVMRWPNIQQAIVELIPEGRRA